MQGEPSPARAHQEQGIALYDFEQHRSLAFRYGSFDPGVGCFNFAGMGLWHLGYPEQALQRSSDAVNLAHQLSHPFSVAFALIFAAMLHHLRREGPALQERSGAAIVLATEHEIPTWLTWGRILQGRALAEQGQVEEGIGQIRQELAAWQAMGSEFFRSQFLGLLAEAYEQGGQAEEGLRVVEEALAFVERTGEHFYEAELHRLKGSLLLQQSPAHDHQAEVCFHKALDVARCQEAKSWELRAATSLARLWQQQGKRAAARDLLAPVYNWFTEGFDTADLQDAKALLDELSI
jgi:adenylate cyclase